MFNIDVDASLQALMPQMPRPSVSGIMTVPVGISRRATSLYDPNDAVS